MALRFLEPMTAPMPVRPATSFRSLTTQRVADQVLAGDAGLGDPDQSVAVLLANGVLDLAGDLAPEVARRRGSRRWSSLIQR